MASSSSRRDFLTGQALVAVAQDAGAALADELAGRPVPGRGPALMLRTSAMATDFDVLLNPGASSDQLTAASAALDEVARLEQQYSTYRPDSELSHINREAVLRRVTVEPRLLDLLARGLDISRLTDGAFNPISGQLIALWRQARREDRLPSEEELRRAVAAADVEQVTIDPERGEIAFSRPGPEFNLGAIGKGYAVDEAGRILDDAGVECWLVHGGKSSVRVRGRHGNHAGWPISLQNPLLPDRSFVTLLLTDRAMSTSGTAVQWFRHGGRRYGHILDPRTGWPVDGLLSVTVLAPDAALADALSTAFFVLGVEKALACCDNFPEVGAILFPLPADGRTLGPILHRVPADSLYFPSPD